MHGDELSVHRDDRVFTDDGAAGLLVRRVADDGVDVALDEGALLRAFEGGALRRSLHDGKNGEACRREQRDRNEQRDAAAHESAAQGCAEFFPVRRGHCFFGIGRCVLSADGDRRLLDRRFTALGAGKCIRIVFHVRSLFSRSPVCWILSPFEAEYTCFSRR